MIRLGTILERIRDVETRTLRKVTDIAITRKIAGDLVSQYNQMVSDDLSLIYENETSSEEYDIYDVGEFLGANILLSIKGRDEFKILEEITPDSE